MVQKLTAATGQCLCGAVSYEVNGDISSFHICYCSRCRHATGSAHAANLFAAPESIRWHSGQDVIQRFELPVAKSWAKQFCRICGSAVPYVNRAGKFLVIPAGSLNGDLPVMPDDRIFCEDRCRWVEAIAQSPEFSGLPTKF